MKGTQQMYKNIACLYKGPENISVTELAREFRRGLERTGEADITIVGKIFERMEPHIMKQFFKWQNIDSQEFESWVNWALYYSLYKFEKNGVKKTTSFQSFFYGCLSSCLHREFLDSSKAHYIYTPNPDYEKDNGEDKEIKIPTSYVSVDDEESFEQFADEKGALSITEVEGMVDISIFRDLYNKDSLEYKFINLVVDRKIMGKETQKEIMEKLQSVLGKDEQLTYTKFKGLQSKILSKYKDYENIKMSCM